MVISPVLGQAATARVFRHVQIKKSTTGTYPGPFIINEGPKHILSDLTLENPLPTLLQLQWTRKTHHNQSAAGANSGRMDRDRTPDGDVLDFSQ